jgi:hypothetical protein
VTVTDHHALATPLLAALEPGARGTLVGLMVAGVLLVLFGARLLRPAVVVAAMAVGFLGAVVTARAMLPAVPLWAAAATGAVAGLVAGAMLYRVAVGLAAATVGATAGALVAFAIMAGGSLDTAPRSLNHALVDTPPTAIRPGDGNRAGLRIVSILDAQDAAQPSGAADTAVAAAADAALPVGERALRRTAAVARAGVDRASAAYRETAPAYRTLLSGSIAAGAIAGLLAGMLATTTVARVLTSFAGGWLLLGATLPLMALHGFEPMPDDARAWLVTLAAIAALGTVAQWKLGGAPGTPRKAKARSRPKPESPAATTAEPAAA